MRCIHWIFGASERPSAARAPNGANSSLHPRLHIETTDRMDRAQGMIDIEALLVMGATATSLSVAIHFLNRFRSPGKDRTSMPNVGDD